MTRRFLSCILFTLSAGAAFGAERPAGPISELTQDSEWKIDDRYHPINGSGGGELLAKWENGVLVGKRQSKNGVEEISFRLAPGGEMLTESIETGANVITLIWRRQ